MAGMWKPVLFVLSIAVVVLVTAEPSTEAKKEDAVSDVTSQESKDKRSQEEIMFGNQQNKPAGLMDDILTYEDKKDEEPIFANSNGNANSVATNITETQKEAEETVDKSEKEQTPTQENPQSKSDVAERRYDYLDYVDDNSEQRYTDNEYSPPSSSGNQQEDAMEPQLYPIPDVGTYPTYDFSNALYRRKRNLRSRVRKRSLRSSLKDLLSGRKRLSRRALRLKRQTNVENLLALLEPLTDMEKEGRYGELPEALNRYDMIPEDMVDMQDAAYGYGYTLPSNTDGYQSPREVLLAEDDVASFPTYGKEEERQPWYYRSQPFYKVERRSSPSFFYPIDYRFINVPTHKKRSRSDGDQERWGKVVQIPSNHSPTEDMARLYALASLLADTEEPEYRYRRSA